MKVILYARRSAADRGQSVDRGLERLRRHAAGRRPPLEVVEEITDTADRHDTPRPGWRRVLELLDAGGAQAVVCESLYRLFPAWTDLVAASRRWADGGIGVISLDDALDTTQPEDALPWRRVLRALDDYARARHSEATQVGLIAHAAAGAGHPLGGRRVVAVDDLEVKRLWEAGESTREIVRRIKAGGGQMSTGTLYKAIARLRAEGRLDDARRAAGKGARPPRRGGRPRKERPVRTRRARKEVR